MKSTAALKRHLAQIRRLCRREQYDLALTQVTDLLETWPDNPQLLLQWASLVQLQDKATDASLDDVKKALERVVDLDEESPAAWLELGHFLNTVKDDTQGASQCFEKAIALGRRFLRDALLAQAQVFTELERPGDALACLAEAYGLRAGNGKPARPPDDRSREILSLLKDITSYQ